MKNKTEISNTVEAALFSAEEPLSIKDLRGMFKPDDAPACLLYTSDAADE